MPKFQAVSRERHSNKRWQRQSSHASEANDTVAPLVISEFSKAAMALPIAFIAQGETYVPAAVLGLQQGLNVFITPDGRWIGQYIPALYRSSPFGLLSRDDGQKVLCIDESIGLASDETTGEPFFGEEGQLASAVQDIVNFLTQVEQSRAATAAVCAALQKHDLLRPWPITLKTETGDQQLKGLFQIDEAALNQLSMEALHEIRQSGALPVTYCQLLSMQHLQMIGQLNDAQQKARQKAEHQSGLNERPNASSFYKSGTISFAGLGG